MSSTFFLEMLLVLVLVLVLELVLVLVLELVLRSHGFSPSSNPGDYTVVLHVVLSPRARHRAPGGGTRTARV